MYVYWFEATPWDPVAGAGVTVRGTSCELPQATTLDSGAEWLPVLVGGPNTSLSVFDGAAIQATRLTSGRIECYANDTLIDDWSNLMWQSRPIKIYEAFIDTKDPANPVFPANLAATTVIFDGQVESFDADRCSFDLTSTVPSGKIASATYAGTGGAEGLASLKGTPKPWASGQHFNRKPVLVHPGLQLYQVHGYGPIEELTNVRERGIILDQTRVTHASSAALIAASVPATEIHVCLATGMFRIGFTPFGDITADFKGDNTGGYSALLGSIVQRLLTGPAGWLLAKIDTSSLTNLNTTIPHAAFAFDDSGTDIVDMLNELLTPIGAYWDVDEATGEFYVGLFRRQVSTTHTISPSTGLVLLDIDELPTRAPFWRNQVGWLFNPTVMEQPIEADAIATAIDIEPGATNDSNLDDPSQLTINEKIKLIPAEAVRSNRKTQVRARLVDLGLSVTALDAAETNWLAYRNSVSAAWNSTTAHSAINRSTWNTLTQAFDAALDASDKLISEEDARRALWTGTVGRPPLITATGITVDETLRDPSVWEYSGTFEADETGGGRFRVLGSTEGYVRTKFENATPIDHNRTYEGFWELYQSIASSSALTSRFYALIRCWDNTGTEISGDGTHWFYPLSYQTMPYGGDWIQFAARFGKGTARPFPTNAARFGIGALLNLSPYGVNNTYVRNMRVREIQSAILKSAAEYNWILGDGLAIRTGGADNGWNNTAYGKAVITGPQRVTFKPVRVGGACVIGLTDSAVPGGYPDFDAAIYCDGAGNLQVLENGSAMTASLGSYTTDTELTVEYDGLRFLYYINGALQTYTSFAGQNRSFRFGIDCYSIKAGISALQHVPARTQAIVGGNTVDANGNQVYLDALRNNMALLDFWRRDVSLPPAGWALNAEYNRIISLPTDVNILPPKAGGNEVWFCQETTGNGEQGGGWDGGQIGPIDKTRTYRFMVPIRRIAGTATSLWGIDGSSVCDLNTTTPNTNPYFAAAGPGSLTIGKWYLFVGYVYPAGSTGHTNDQSGIYDCSTGEKVGTGTSYCWRAATSSQVTHRAYQYYSTLNAQQVFGRPIVNLVDGTEPSLREYFGDTAVLNSEQQWFDISGIGRPQDYATSSDNMIKNGSMLNGGEDWSAFSGATFTTYGAGSTSPVPAYVNFPNGTGAYIYANREQVMQLEGARTLFASGYSNKAGGLVAMSATVNWYKNDGSLSSITATTTRSIIPAATGAWESFLVSFVAPSDATQFQFNLSADGSNTNFCYAGGIRLSRTEPAADVTSTITGSAEIVIECDHTGAPVAGQPGAAVSPADKVVLYKLFRNGVDVTTTATWSRTLITGSLTSSASTGALTISAIGSLEAIVRMTAVQGGSTRSMDVKVRKNLAPPPTGGSGGGGSSGGTSASDSTFTSTTTSSHVVISDELTIDVGTAGNVNLTAPLSFTITTGSAGNYGCYLRWQEWNGSAWVDVGTAEVESQFYASRYFDDALGANVSEPGSVTCNVTLTGRSGTKKYRLTARNGIGTTSVARHYSGTATAQG